jgi:glycosyltransferase involved in cell wall biosynthesis
MTKKVAFCINDLSLAGAENITFNILVNLLANDKISKDSVLVLFNDNISDFFFSKIQNYNIKIQIINERSYNFKYFSIFSSLFRAFFFFRYNKFNVIYVNLFPSLIIISILSKLKLFSNTKLIFTEHSVSNNRPKNKLYNYLERLFYKEYDHVVCISDTVRSSLVDRFGDMSNLIVIKNGLPPFIDFSPDDIPIRKELNLRSDSTLLLMTSRIGDGKDHLTLLRAFESIFFDDFYLLFIGGGDFSHIKSSILNNKARNNIIFLGLRKDARKIMKEVNINILSSAYEGVSGVTLEAFESMKPFIGSNVDGIRELVGTPLSLFEFGNKEDLAKKILLILNNDEVANTVVELNKNMLNKFDFNKQVEHVLKLF